MNARDRHNRAAHCMQAGVKLDFARRGFPDNSEHMQARVGINTALRDHSSLVALLLKKGVITDEEYCEALAAGMEEEVRMYEAELTKAYGGNTKITLVGRYGSVHDEEVAS